MNHNKTNNTNYGNTNMKHNNGHNYNLVNVQIRGSKLYRGREQTT